ncbi:MAG: sialidase family protein [Planctomycetota bacterium]
MLRNARRAALIATGLLLAACAAPAAHDGPPEPFLAAPRIELQQVFAGGRFPNAVVTREGTVLLTWGASAVRARRSEDGGATFGPEIDVADPGFQGGGTTVDEESGDVLAFVEAGHPPAAITVYRSEDDGRTWLAEDATVHPDRFGNAPSMHMNEHGITLRRGRHAGRLLRPSRWYAGANERERWPDHYTNAIYSDDGGRTWSTSDPFPENGTGEAAVAELRSGRIYYNSRVHWEERPDNTRRRAAWSDDGGETWTGWHVVDVLPDGHQHRSYGCMGGLVRLPIEGEDVLLFSNLDTANATRERVTVWASFDGGRTWPAKRLVFEGASAYSSLAAGRPGTPSEGWVYLLFEGGPEGGGTIARFRLSWLLAGERTGDGSVPQRFLR